MIVKSWWSVFTLAVFAFKVSVLFACRAANLVVDIKIKVYVKG